MTVKQFFPDPDKEPDSREIMDSTHTEYRWHFSCEMISECEPLFDELKDNLEVEKLLIDHQVIIQENQPDSESMLFYVFFSNKEHYIGFIERLNKFLVKYALDKE